MEQLLKLASRIVSPGTLRVGRRIGAPTVHRDEPGRDDLELREKCQQLRCRPRGQRTVHLPNPIEHLTGHVVSHSVRQGQVTTGCEDPANTVHHPSGILIVLNEMQHGNRRRLRPPCGNPPPGFVLVVDEYRLAWPECRGNGVMASLANMGKNPNAGLLFIDFTESLIGLHVNGRARILTDEAMRHILAPVSEVTVPGQLSQQWVLLDVEEAYIHCAKRIPRLRRVPHARVWSTDDTRRKGGDFFGGNAERNLSGQ